MAGGKRNKITPKRKHEAIQLVLEEKMSIEEAAKKKGMGKSTLAKIISDFKKNGNKITMDEDDTKPFTNSESATPKQSELIDLKNQIKQLKREKDTLKRTIAILMNDDS